VRNIKNYELDERIRVSLLKHRGDVLAVKEELNLPLAYVQRIYKKMRKAWDRDTSAYVSSKLMEHLFYGYQQRIVYLKALLDKFESFEKEDVSGCCSAPVVRSKVRRTFEFVCTKCLQPCYVVKGMDKEVQKLYQQAIEQLREEDKALVEFAHKLGFVHPKSEGPNVKVDQKIVVLNQGKEEPVAKQLQELSPIEREKVRKAFEKSILSVKGTKGKPQG